MGVCMRPASIRQCYIPVAVLKVRQGPLQASQLGYQNIKAVAAVLHVSLPPGRAFDAMSHENRYFVGAVQWLERMQQNS